MPLKNQLTQNSSYAEVNVFMTTVSPILLTPKTYFAVKMPLHSLICFRRNSKIENVSAPLKHSLRLKSSVFLLFLYKYNIFYI